MTPKEVIAKHYECFDTGDMETFVSLYHDDVVGTVNGMHRFSGIHNGMDAWLGGLSEIPERYEEFSVTSTNMISEGEQVFTQIHAKDKELDAKFGHYHKLVEGKIKKFWIYDDSHKMAYAMKAGLMQVISGRTGSLPAYYCPSNKFTHHQIRTTCYCCSGFTFMK